MAMSHKIAGTVLELDPHTLTPEIREAVRIAALNALYPRPEPLARERREQEYNPLFVIRRIVERGPIWESRWANRRMIVSGWPVIFLDR